MKLIYCVECGDVVRLSLRLRHCECGLAWGNYLEDGLHAITGGAAVPLGFRNDEFFAALKDRSSSGKGARFAAFVIPYECDTVAQR